MDCVRVVLSPPAYLDFILLDSLFTPKYGTIRFSFIVIQVVIYYILFVFSFLNNSACSRLFPVLPSFLHHPGDGKEARRGEARDGVHFLSCTHNLSGDAPNAYIYLFTRLTYRSWIRVRGFCIHFFVKVWKQ